MYAAYLNNTCCISNYAPKFISPGLQCKQETMHNYITLEGVCKVEMPTVHNTHEPDHSPCCISSISAVAAFFETFLFRISPVLCLQGMQIRMHDYTTMVCFCECTIVSVEKQDDPAAKEQFTQLAQKYNVRDLCEPRLCVINCDTM